MTDSQSEAHQHALSAKHLATPYAVVPAPDGKFTLFAAYGSSRTFRIELDADQLGDFFEAEHRRLRNEMAEAHNRESLRQARVEAEKAERATRPAAKRATKRVDFDLDMSDIDFSDVGDIDIKF